MLHNQIKTGIIKALCYSDVFDFPLLRSEICKFFIGTKTESYPGILKEIDNLLAERIIFEEDGYIHLGDKQKTVEVRKKRIIISKKKLYFAKKVACLLGKIPTVKFIGISGSLSMDNSKEEDDIDFFFITSRNSLWLTRFAVNILLLIRGYKRSRKASFTMDKICPNMFVAEDALKFKQDKQNLFTAHEIVQLKAVVNKSNTYENFLIENDWLLKFLPNTRIQYEKAIQKKVAKISLGFLNDIFFIMQYVYMMKRMTTEEVRINVARFHPRDMSYYVLEMYKLKRRDYQFSLDNLNNSVRKVGEDTPGY